nr:hypothetical protein [Cytophagales bacterium]
MLTFVNPKPSGTELVVSTGGGSRFIRPVRCSRKGFRLPVTVKFFEKMSKQHMAKVSGGPET